MKHLPSETNLIETAASLAQALKAGNINLQINGIESADLNVENQTINLDFAEEEHLKSLFKQLRTGQEKSLSQLRDFAEKLKANGSTLTISVKGKTVITLGHKANPVFSKMLTQTDSIELNNLAILLDLVR